MAATREGFMSTPCTLGFWEDHHVDFSGLHQAQAEDGCVEHSNLPTVGVSHRVPQRLHNKLQH
ncbi:MAG: hypothetical protein DMG44_07185 [Acidobacteria bacterium]|jgi:hypothetical protein|nr:MAG: hypothetical protein DMG44_07185 [Acidobacteriota bacterium]